MNIKVPYFKQQNDYFCGPAVLQMIFSFFGQMIDQKTLAQKIGTTIEHGTHKEKMIKISREFGYDVWYQEKAKIEDLKNNIDLGLPVIINNLDTKYDEGHYAVVVGYDDKNIIVNDPEYGLEREVPIPLFLKEWEGRENWALVIKK